MRKIKVRIIGSESECHELEQILRATGRVKTVRRIDRSQDFQEGRIYSRTFGTAESVYYIEMRKKNKGKEQTREQQWKREYQLWEQDQEGQQALFEQEHDL